MPSSSGTQNSVDDLSPINSTQDFTTQFDFARPSNFDTPFGSSFQNDNPPNNSQTTNPNATTSTSPTTTDVLFKQLTKAAKTYNVKTLKYDVDPIKRRDEFMHWIDKIKDMTYTQQDTMNLL